MAPAHPNDIGCPSWTITTAMSRSKTTQELTELCDNKPKASTCPQIYPDPNLTEHSWDMDHNWLLLVNILWSGEFGGSQDWPEPIDLFITAHSMLFMTSLCCRVHFPAGRTTDLRECWCHERILQVEENPQECQDQRFFPNRILHCSKMISALASTLSGINSVDDWCMDHWKRRVFPA